MATPTASSLAPATTPPPGVSPNFVNPTSLYPEALITIVLCFSLTTLFTAARLIAKWSISPWTLDDYFLLVAWAANIAYTSVVLVLVQAGFGRHLWDVPVSHLLRLSQLSFVVETLNSPTIWLAKTALLLQLMRIFAPTKIGPIYWVIQTLIWGNLAFYTSIFVSLFFQCVPLVKSWNSSFVQGHCINFNAGLLSTGSFNALSDLLILLLPLWATWHLQMGMKQKMGIMAVFGTGLLAFASSICRVAYTLRLLSSTDDTYISAQITMWTLAEISTIILCTCFPMVPRFTQLILRRKASPHSGRSDMPHGRRTKVRHHDGKGESFEVLHDDSSGSGRDRAGMKDVHLPLEDREEKDGGGGGGDRHVVDGLGEMERFRRRDVEAGAGCLGWK